MARLLHALLLGLFGAGIVHIAVLFLLPLLGERDAWSQLAAAADSYTATRLPSAGAGAPLPALADPLFEAVACRFDLADGPVHVRGEGAVPFWSMSVYDRRGLNIYSFSDRTANDAQPDFVILTPDDLVALRAKLPAAYAESIFVEAPVGEGMVVVRAFRPDDTWRHVVDGFLDSISCSLR